MALFKKNLSFLIPVFLIGSCTLFSSKDDEDKIDYGDWPRDTQTTVVEITNPATGRTWMDRNLGASRAAISSTDEQAHGDLYQWGRAADGHQKRNSPTTTAVSSTDQPGHGSFIDSRRTDANSDWRNPQNDNLWQGVNGINNPRPPGWRLPTEAEWEAERESWLSNDPDVAFASPLKLSLAGDRGEDGIGLILGVGSSGGYWSSTVDDSGARELNFFFGDGDSDARMSSFYRGIGLSVRCTKD